MIQGWRESQLSLLRGAAEWAESNVAPHAEAHDRENMFQHMAWEDMAEKGIWRAGMLSQRDCWDFCALLEGVASAALDTGFVVTMAAHGAFMRGLALHGNEALNAWATPLLEEGVLTATAIAEPHSGTDTIGARTVAEPLPEGGYRLTGMKTNIAHASTARMAIVTAQIKGQSKDGISLFVVDTEKPGYSAGEPEDKPGNRSLPTSWMKLEGVEVPEWALLGEPGRGSLALTSIGMFARACYGIAAGNLPRPVLAAALKWAKTRHSMGRAVADFQHLQHRFTEVEMALQTARWMGLAGMGALLRMEDEAVGLCSAAKIRAAENFQSAMGHLVAIQGSVGYQRGAAERLMRDAMGWSSMGGTQEMHRILLWREMKSRKDAPKEG